MQIIALHADTGIICDTQRLEPFLRVQRETFRCANICRDVRYIVDPD